MQLNKFQGDRNPRGRPKGHGVAWYLKKIGEELSEDGKITKNEAVAKLMFDLALDPEVKPQDKARIATDIMDRQDGKPIATNINAEIVSNPFEDIDTSKLEAMRNELLSHEKESKAEEKK